MPVELKRLTAAEARRALDALADVLCDAVDGGDSVSFMDGFGTDDARAFYASLLPELEAGTRVLLAAYVDGELVGTVQLVHAWPPNSQHRADVAKLLVHRRVRGQGVGRALMEQLEQEARADGKSLLILDTAAERARGPGSTTGSAGRGSEPCPAMRATLTAASAMGSPSTSTCDDARYGDVGPP